MVITLVNVPKLSKTTTFQAIAMLHIDTCYLNFEIWSNVHIEKIEQFDSAVKAN